VRNVKKVQSARPKSAARGSGKPPTAASRATNNRDLILNENDEEDPEAWFRVEEAGVGDQATTMPPPREAVSPVRQVRETI
jgi:hypothetical protein